MKIYQAFLSISLAVSASSVLAAPSFNEQSICESRAAHHAAQARIPDNILHGIVRTESSSHPWAINYKGKGFFFDTKSQALDYARGLWNRGITNFDVGCAQINLRWHPEAFDSLEEAFDPDANLAYAAKFLNTIRYEYGARSWPEAVGKYHSSTPGLGSKYAKVVYRRIKQAPVHTLAVYNGFEEYGGQDLGVGDVPKVAEQEAKMPEIHITADGAISREAIEVVTAVEPQADLGGRTSSMRGVIGNMKPRKNMKTEPKSPKNMKKLENMKFAGASKSL